jgi:hypothetical protein
MAYNLINNKNVDFYEGTDFFLKNRFGCSGYFYH